MEESQDLCCIRLKPMKQFLRKATFSLVPSLPSDWLVEEKVATEQQAEYGSIILWPHNQQSMSIVWKLTMSHRRPATSLHLLANLILCNSSMVHWQCNCTGNAKAWSRIRCLLPAIPPAATCEDPARIPVEGQNTLHADDQTGHKHSGQH